MQIIPTPNCDRIRVDGHLSIGHSTALSDGVRVFAFRKWDKIYWCGNYTTMRKTKSQARVDARKLQGKQEVAQ
jgi:hypothetical protein